MNKRVRVLHMSKYIGAVDDDELKLVLESEFGLAAQLKASEVEYRTRDDEWILTVRYKNDSMVDIIAGSACAIDHERRVEAAIEDGLLGTSTPVVCRCTLFASRAVNGYWRHDDGLQIVPAPPNAPRPETIIGEYPFIVDFAFADSPNGRVRSRRMQTTAVELCRLLNLLIRGGVTMLSNRSAHHWVVVPPDAPGGSLRVIWANEGYFIEGFHILVSEMPSIESIPALVETDAYTYFNNRWYVDDDFTIPTVLSQFVDAYRQLAESRQRFDRALYWYAKAQDVWLISVSLYVTSLVNAIESIAVDDSDRREAEGPSTTFKRFMRQYAPGQPSSNVIDRLYTFRSDITHGSTIHASDRFSPTSMDQSTAEHRQSTDDAHRLVRGAMINWLWSHTTNGNDDPLVTLGVDQSKPQRPGTKADVEIWVAE